jgi:N-acetyl-alpha-D-glucosaminyl L-malate synthase BshA
VSQSLKDDTYRLFDVTNDIVVIPNFIELAKENKRDNYPCHRSLMASENEKIVTHISNFRKVKRIEDVVKIFFEIQKEVPSKLMMVGEGPEKEQAEYLCQQLGIQHKVIFFGNSNEIDKILCFSDLFLLPSETESFGLAALEAMACGVPVISSNSGGLPEVNKDGFSGYLSNVGDVMKMSQDAISLLQDTIKLKQFKSNALETAKLFDIQHIMPMYENLYYQAIQSKHD